MKQTKFNELIEHKTKLNSLTKFLFLIILLIIYFIYISNKYGSKNGFFITILTWSFFVFCTPIADAGFILDFPIRIFTKIRMIYSEITVWVFAFILNLTTILTKPEVYQKTTILKIFYIILIHPLYWIIILLSGLGTYLSIYFGDELIDVVKHKDRKKYHKHINKYQIITFLFIISAILIIYNILLKNFGLKY